MLYNLSTHTLEYLKCYNVLSAFPLTKQILTQWFRAEHRYKYIASELLEFTGQSFDKQIRLNSFSDLFFSRIA